MRLLEKELAIACKEYCQEEGRVIQRYAQLAYIYTIPEPLARVEHAAAAAANPFVTCRVAR